MIWPSLNPVDQGQLLQLIAQLRFLIQPLMKFKLDSVFKMLVTLLSPSSETHPKHGSISSKWQILSQTVHYRSYLDI